MKSVLGLLALLLLAAGVGWVVVGVRKYRARKQAEALREAAFLAELARSAAAKGGKTRVAAPAPKPAAAPAASPAAARPAAPAAAPARAVAAPQAAALAIKAALAQANSGEAARLFLLHAAQRTGILLDPGEWNSLGEALLAQGAYLEAAWALHAGALLAGDAVGAQRRLIEVAGRASAARQPQVALKLYQTLVAKYPASDFVEFARAGIRLEEKNLGKG
jgi:hypothetical protein